MIFFRKGLQVVMALDGAEEPQPILASGEIMFSAERVKAGDLPAASRRESPTTTTRQRAKKALRKRQFLKGVGQ